MKLILRADDVGYTPVNNIGVFKAIDEGLITSADLMLDCPGFEEAVAFLKERPWISVGWHAHFWGRPVLPPEQVPSMVNEEGKFKWRKDRKKQEECVYEEVLAESRAQLERTCRLLGRVPDYTGAHVREGKLSVFESARLKACDEFGIPYGFCNETNPEDIDPKYAGLDILKTDQIRDSCYDACYDNDYRVRLSYDPLQYLNNVYPEMAKHRVAITAWHPGYLDEYILAESSLHIARIQDLKALCSGELHDWIKENHIELVNYRDALYGTRSYQNHLREIGSDLYIPCE